MALLMKVTIKLTIGWLTLFGYFILAFITKLIHWFNALHHRNARKSPAELLLQEPEQASDVELAINPRTRMVIGTGAIGATMMDNSTSLLVFDYKIQGLQLARATIYSSTSNTDDSDDADDSARDDTDSEPDRKNRYGPERNSSEPPEERYEVAPPEQVTNPKPFEPKNKSKKKKAKRSKQKANKSSTPSQMKRGKPSSTAKQLESPNYAITLDGATMQRQHHPVKRPYYKQSTATVDQDS